MAEETQLLVVPHTHWDREWYQTFQQFRMRLVRAVDRVLDVLERDPTFTYFMLDGQTIVLEDYLAIRPENEDRLRALIEAGRLQIGPWYLQPDEFLVGGESLIRNLHRGLRMANGFGGTMPIGYVPDTFGHIAQLPQILRGFGLDNAVFWRGVPPEIERSAFRWAAPDGSEVLAIWLSHEIGYSNASQLPFELDPLIARLGLITSALRPRATTNVLLLMNGSDHQEPQEGLPLVIAEANAVLEPRGQHLLLGTLPQYVAVVRESGVALERYSGELRSSRHAHLLPGVYSTRMWLKQRNAACEALLTRWTEPATTWAWALGCEYPRTLLDLSWKHLLHNHPHDSICGCGIDQVHFEMLARFDQSQQIAEALTTQALASIAEQIDTTNVGRGTPVVVFNPSAHPRSDIAAAEIELPANDVEVVDPQGRPVPFALRPEPSAELLRQEVDKALVVSMLDIANDGTALDYVITDVRVSASEDPSVAAITVTASREGTPDASIVARAKEEVREWAARPEITTFRAVAYEAPRTEVRFLARDVAPNGLRTFLVRPRGTAAPTSAGADATDSVHVEGMNIENRFLRVRVEADTGTIALLDKARGVEYTGLNRIVDSGDVGDLYTFCPPKSDWTISEPCRPPTFETIEAGPLRATLRVKRIYRLPTACADDRTARGSETVECVVTSDISLLAEGQRVEVRTTVANAARDHRLRVVFPVPFTVAEAEAEGVFEVARRRAQVPTPDGGWKGWAEHPVNTHPHKRFVSVGCEGAGLAILNRGIAEYEALPQFPQGKASEGGALALTLLRCVEWLSRNDLDTRAGHAGPALHTPEAQGLGAHTFEYAIVPHGGTWHADGALVRREAEAFEAPLRALGSTRHAGTHPGEWSFLQLEQSDPPTLSVSAITRAEDAVSMLVRVYNAGRAPASGTLRVGVPVAEVTTVTLNEETVPGADDGAFAPDKNQIPLTLRPGEIRTLRLRLSRV